MCAEERTRTSTRLLPLEPESSASTSSATSAKSNFKKRCYVYFLAIEKK